MTTTYRKKRRPSDHVEDNEDTQEPSSDEKINEGDTDVWPAEEILGEKNGRYLIRWGGEDPYGKPWENSWVRKHDVTDDLITEWNKKKPPKKKGKPKGKSAPSKPYQPPAHRKLGESSSNATLATKRSLRSSASLAPDSTSTRRGATLAKPETLKTPPKKRKRAAPPVSSSISSLTTTDEESDDDSKFPRKRRKTTEEDTSTLSTPPTVPRSHSLKSDRNQIVEPAAPSAPDIYDDIPAPSPVTHEMKKLLEKAKGVSKSASNGRLNDNHAEISVAGPSRVDKNDMVPSDTEKDGRPRRLVKESKQRRRQGEKRPGTPEGTEKAEEEEEEEEAAATEGSVRRRDEEEEEDDWGRRIGAVKAKDTLPPKASSSKSNSRPLLGETSDDETQRSKMPDRFTTPKDAESRNPAIPEAQADDIDADGEPDDENAAMDLDNTFNDNSPLTEVDDLPLLPSIDTNQSPHNSPPPRHSPSRSSSKEPTSAAVDSSIGTVIPETQSSKHNSSIDESSQPAAPNGITRPPDTQGTQEDDSVSNLSSSGKVLKPIPVVTPSKFHPHLRAQSSVTGRAAALRKQFLSTSEHLDPPPSSIVSQFSPEKNGENAASHLAVNGDGDTDMGGIEDDIENLEPSIELKARGIELAEMDRMQRRAKLPVQKRSLDGILHHRDTRPDAPAGHTQLDEDALVQQMEERYVNLDGGADPTNVNSENTVEDPKDASGLEKLDPYLTGIVEETRNVSPTTEDSRQDDPQPVERPHTPPQSHIPQQKRQIINSPTRQLDSALGLLNQKSEEIHHLKRRLSGADEEQRKRAARITQLEAENAQLVHEQSRTAQLEPTILAELDMIRKERDDIANERDSALAELDLMKMSKQAALDDAAFIREQYALVSDRADELIKENKELVYRAQSAESRVTQGLQLVRNDRDARIAALNVELEKSRIVNKILVERDRRTDDEVRKTAATVPQLEATIERLTRLNSDRKDEINALVHHRDILLTAKAESKDELDRLREQDARSRADILHLSVEVARFGARERSVRKLIHPSPPAYDGDTEIDPADEDVYLCEWLVGGEARCGELFSSVQDLQDHLFISAHL